MVTDQKHNSCNSVLVVEDDDDIRSVLVDLLENEGFATLSAGNGKEALELLKESAKPCLVLLDMMMPIMDGREFLDEVMKDSYLAPIPVVIVSAIADKVNTQGAIAILKKPIDIDVVLKMVQKFCEVERDSRSTKDSVRYHPEL